jgi:hypothetical protein
MKSSKLKIGIIGILHFAFCIVQCRADLSATVSPGYQFNTTERPTVTKLNLLGTPTITITGTIGGTNAGIGAATISGTMMVDTFVDGTNITWNTASPRRLKIVDGGVGVTQISSNIAGLGLTGGSGTNLNVAVHTNGWLSIYNGKLSVTTNGLGIEAINGFTNIVNTLSSNMTSTVLSNQTFTSLDYTIIAGLVANTNHSLGVKPKYVSWVLVCVTNDLGYVVGDEVAPGSFMMQDAQVPMFAWGANTTNVFLIKSAQSGDEQIARKDTGAAGGWTSTNWKARCYARP